MRRAVLFLAAALLCGATSGRAAVNGVVAPLLTPPSTSCITGTAITPPATGVLVYPAVVPQRTQANDIVGLNLLNNSSGNLGNYLTFGQAFKDGDLNTATDGLRARVGATYYAAQVDPISTYADGSVRFANVTVNVSPCSGSFIGVMLNRTAAPRAPPVNIFTGSATLTAAMTFTQSAGYSNQNVDLWSKLQATSSAPDYWLQGPLATQARVDYVVPGGTGALHLTADVTKYADGSLVADVQFNNDRGTLGGSSPGAATTCLIYSETVTLNSSSETYSLLASTGQPGNIINGQQHCQYMDWHANLATATGGVGPWSAVNYSSSASTSPLSGLTTQPDAHYLQAAGAIPSFDLTTGIYSQGSGHTLPAGQGSIFDRALSNLAQGVTYASKQYNWNSPITAIKPATGSPPTAGPGLFMNINTDMGHTGDEYDIGYISLPGSGFFVTGDPTIATMMMGWADGAGMVPWNYFYAGATPPHWLTSADNLNVDARPACGAACLAQQQNFNGWLGVDELNAGLDPAHQSDMVFGAYLMTGMRWYQDRLFAQAAFGNSYQYNANRCSAFVAPANPNCDSILAVQQIQPRASAWIFREVLESYYFGKSSSYDVANWGTILGHNWSLISTIKSIYQSATPVTYGYIISPGHQVAGCATCNQEPGFQQDYLLGIQSWFGYAAPDANAASFAEWEYNWSTGRLISAVGASNGYYQYNSCAYQIAVMDFTTAAFLQTWADMQTQTVTYDGGVVPPNTWEPTLVAPFNFCAIERGSIGLGLSLLPNDSQWAPEYVWLSANGPVWTQPSISTLDNRWNIVQLQKAGITAKIDNGSGGSGTNLHVTAKAYGALAAGQYISGTGVDGLQMITNIGTCGGSTPTLPCDATVSVSQNISSEAMTGI